MADEFSWSAEQEQGTEFLFHPVGAAILGFIFTLPVACVLHALNWRHLGNNRLYRANLVLALIWLILVGIHIVYVCNLVL